MPGDFLFCQGTDDYLLTVFCGSCGSPMVRRTVNGTVPAGSCVVLVFDTDKDETEHLKKNIELLQSLSFKVEILTIMQVLNFEDEIERATDVKSALDLTKSASLKDFKNAVNRAKEKDFRSTLQRHKLDMTKLWTQKPPKTFGFIKQDAEKIKI